MYSGLKDRIKEYRPLNGFDIIVFLFVLVFCFFSFEHPDILHTGGSSFTLLDGHFTDFYEANAKKFEITNYMISTYILFGIWNLPLKVMGVMKEVTNYFDVGGVIFWYKLLPSLFYAATAVVVFKIGLNLRLNKKMAVTLAIFWATTPIAFFSQFIFGQYDIFTLFFTLLGVLFFLKKNRKLFLLFFGIAMTFKYFPLFVFIPLLLLIEKKVTKLVIQGLIFLSPLVLEILLYFHSSEFHRGVFGFSANQRMFTAGLHIEFGITISVFIIVWGLLCVFAYLKDITNDDEFMQWGMYIPLVASCLIFSLVLSHPQWLIFATPFIAITSFMHKRFNFFAFVDLIAMFIFVGFVVNAFQNNVDQTLWEYGIFNEEYNPMSTISMNSFFPPHDLSIYFSFLTTYFLANIIFKFPKLDIHRNVSGMTKESWNLIRLRFLGGVLIFIIPAVISLMAPNYGDELINIEKKYGVEQSPVGEIVKGTKVGEVFKVDSKNIKRIDIRFATYARKNKVSLKFELKEYIQGHEGKLLYSKEINASDIVDNDYLSFRFVENPISIQKDHQYVLLISSKDASPGHAVTVYRTKSSSLDSYMFMLNNGEMQPFNLAYKVYGDR